MTILFTVIKTETSCQKLKDLVLSTRGSFKLKQLSNLTFYSSREKPIPCSYVIFKQTIAVSRFRHSISESLDLKWLRKLVLSVFPFVPRIVISCYRKKINQSWSRANEKSYSTCWFLFTIMDRILKTNSSFHVKQGTMEKVRFLFFKSLLLVLTKFSFCPSTSL